MWARLSSNRNTATDCIMLLELYHRVGKGHLLQKRSKRAKEALAKCVLEFTKPMKNFNQLQ